MSHEERVAALRAAMEERGIDAYLLPSADPHQSEYPAEHWKGRAWLSGFTGSAGLLVITAEHAGLWTDSRYFLQAEQQLAGGPFVLHRKEKPQQPEHLHWLVEQLDPGSTVGCDGRLFSVNQIRHMKRLFQPADISLQTDLALLDDIWEDRPALPTEPVTELDVAYAGQTRRDKLAQLRTRMQEANDKVTHYLVTALDDIAWLLNLRGRDVEFNPVFMAFLLVGKRKAHLFVSEEKIPGPISEALAEDKVSLKPYEAIRPSLNKLPGNAVVWCDPASVHIQLAQSLEEEQVHYGSNLVGQMKAIKNDTELAHLRATMEKDGVALVKLYRWLDLMLESQTVTEYELARQLDRFRRAQGDYHGESFSAIVGYGANGAIVHYRPDPETSAEIAPSGILLLDSGGQYTTGTTDITRTTALSAPDDVHKDLFTRVLKGHINLAMAHFPKGTRGVQLDTLARIHLWNAGRNFGHGTGHGVGFFLNVHEGPQGFAPSIAAGRGTTAFEPGMLTSNEPGYYETGAFGIRIENLVLCVEDEAHDGFLHFETLTLFPIDHQLIDATLLTRDEKQWLNQYHAMVFERLAPHLNPEEVDWLQEKCKPL